MTELVNDWELLAQRFLDQELSAEERLQFIVRLGRDETLRQRVIDLERLALSAAELPRPVMPEGFATRVMQGTDPADQGSRLSDIIWAPRVLRWNLATAVAAASLALLVAGGLFFTRATVDPPPAAAAASPSTVLVRLVIVQPGARTVQVAGDFNGWKPTSLVEVSDGAWTVTIPMKAGRYEYMYVVDGHQWIADPFAAERNEDGFGSTNAVLDVRPSMQSFGAPL